MAIRDRKGYIYIKGRCKNMILTGSGQNIYPEEIEEMINSLPIVVEPLVVSRKLAIVALVAVDANAVEAAGGEQQLRAELERQVFALNVKLPSYSQISICELRTGHLRRLPSRASSDFVQLISDVLYAVRMSLQILLEK